MTRTWRAAALVLLLGLAAVSAQAADKWKRLDSKTLVVVGNVPAATLKEIAVRLEQFREVFFQLLPSSAATASVPMVVIAFPNEQAYKPFWPSFGGRTVRVGGFFQRREDADYITLNAEFGEQVYRIIFHEYAHSIVGNALPWVPVWLNEGLAEYYSTFEATTSGDLAYVGRPIPEHVNLLRTATLLPIEQLLAVEQDSPQYNESDRRTLFYAQAWALVHYLAVESQVRAGQLSRFVDLLGGGRPQAEAFRQAFQCEPAELGKELSRYVNQRSFRYRRYNFTHPIGIDREGEVAAISGAETDAYLADVLWRSHREAEARARLEAALKADPDNARAHAVLGTLEASREQFDTAIAQLERAVALAPADAVFHYNLGAAVLRQVLKAGWEDGDEPRFRKARGALERAVALRPAYAEAMASLALVMILAGEDVDRGVTLIGEARRLLPGREDYARIEAQGLAAQGKYPEARGLLGRAMARSRSEAFKAEVREQLGQIVALERAAQGQAGAAGAEGGRFPVLRKLGTGEQRVFGTFEAIDCEQGTAALRLAAEGGTKRFLIREWGKAEFITYREDVSGVIECGPRTVPVAVLVTWRPVQEGTPAGDRLDGELVALEIVPQGYVPR